jgi:hypothetical protein
MNYPDYVVQQMVSEAVAKEREACAKIIDDYRMGSSSSDKIHVSIAAAIRARSE